MTNLIAYLLYVVVSLFGYSMPVNSHVDLCQGTSIDNLDYALYLPDDTWLLHFRFDDPYTVVIVEDSCTDWYQAVEISSQGITTIDF